MSESEHYFDARGGAFLSFGGLPGRWADRRTFTVCDTGFDIGQRFVATLAAWRADPDRSIRLHYIGFAPRWVSTNACRQAWRAQGADGAAQPVAELLALWAEPMPGISRMELEEGRVTLTLFYMPLKRALQQASACVDVYFLDAGVGRLVLDEPGYSPFGQLTRMAASGATVVANCNLEMSAVKKGLQNAGFIFQPAQPTEPSWLVAQVRTGVAHGGQAVSSTRKVAIVGGGIAGAGVAYSLALRGHQVVVLDPALAVSAKGTHEGHLAAAATPVLSRDDDHRARLSRVGVQLAWLRWQGLAGYARPVRAGTAVVATDPQEEARLFEAVSNSGLPQTWASWHTNEDDFGLAGVSLDQPFVHLPAGLLIRPDYLVEALLGQPLVSCVPAFAAALRRTSKDQWDVLGEQGQILVTADDVVLANAAGTVPLLRDSGVHAVPSALRTMQAIAGQVSYFRERDVGVDTTMVLDGRGYWLPAIEGLHVAGGTYDLDAHEPAISDAGHDDVIEKVRSLLPEQACDKLSRQAAAGGWAGWRAVVPGRLPVVGELDGHSGLWLACAYGSRGLTWSALAGEIIAAGLSGEPMPVERDLLRAIKPR